ncbi:DUF6892 domain-containing protein [Pedobacter sp. NJ-S-72]
MGEYDTFNIKSFKDAEQFKNLKSMILFYDTDPKERAYLKQLGIEVKDL